MKKLFLLLTAAMLFASTGCDEDDCSDMIWDFVCYDIRFLVTDAEGNNLMDPDVEGNLLENGIYAEYRGRIYNLNADAAETRALPARWGGLRTYRSHSPSFNSPVMLLFGEFSPTSNYRGETFTIHWGDGTSDEVKFDMYITGTNCDPKVHKKLWINGEAVPITDGSYYIQIVK